MSPPHKLEIPEHKNRMTKYARIVLQDCKHAIAKHTDDLQAEDFRISWISVVTLLRAIGHVLEKVDAQQSPAIKKQLIISGKSFNNQSPSLISSGVLLKKNETDS